MPGVDAAALLDECERARELPGRDPAEEAVLLLGGAGFGDDRRELRDGRQEGPGREHPAELLDDDRELHRAHPEPAGALGDGQRRPPELDHLAPEGVGRRSLLDDLAHQADGALTGEHGADAVAQLVLLGCELQVHGDRALSET